MHIPDGYLGPATYGSLWAAMVPIWMYASRKVKEKFRTSQIPFLAMASAFSLVVMLFAVPLPGGTTGHMAGSTLIAVLLGPWAGILSVSTALATQAVVFGDGGITAIGANCFNMAFIGSLVGYGTYRLFAAVGTRISGKKTGNRLPHQAGFTFSLIGAGVGAYASVNLGALFTAVELGIQPVIHPGAGYFPFPLNVAIPAVMLPHLTAVGALEAIVTVPILAVLHKFQTDTMKSWKSVVIVHPLPSSADGPFLVSDLESPPTHWHQFDDSIPTLTFSLSPIFPILTLAFLKSLPLTSNHSPAPITRPSRGPPFPRAIS